MEHGSTGSRAEPDDAVEHGSTSSPTESGDADDPGGEAEAADGLHVTVGPLDDAAGFYVADDGRGIPPEHREDVFEHGFSTGDDGTGLGLTIVREIAEAHGWTVTATESETGGARFEFRAVDD